MTPLEKHVVAARNWPNVVCIGYTRDNFANPNLSLLVSERPLG
jgi:hypothetical protein